MIDNDKGRAERKRDELGLQLQRRLGERLAHTVWLGALMVLTMAVGLVQWFVSGSLLAAIAGHPELRPAFALGLTAPAPFVLAALFVPGTEPWACDIRRADAAIDRLRPRIDDGMAILGAYVVCLMLASLVLGPDAHPLGLLGLGSAAMVAVVVGWRWSAAGRERTLRPFTAMQIVGVVVVGLWFVNLAAGSRL